ncbi:hypothetical protein DIURU_005565 [Diutina rugosa]|uniref:OPT family small oligopeptide transporter n=1 Tax=Diutina rugosa TaxID=5481 RepID=A0A642UCQ1_DIURU|nr:uncharacterized protein DIURU_005565 [Diutina rugosa]KAA8896825.1 hypothetical protein DIURU_005565 [Diutina rugosa]
MAESVELRDLGPPSTPADPSEDAKTGFSDRQLRLVLLRLGSLSRAEYYDTSLATADVFQSTSVRYMVDKVRGLSSDHAVAILRDALADHLDDVNFPRDEYQLLQRLLEDKDDDYTHSEKPYLSVTDRDLQIRLEAALIRYHSPYPEVRAITDPYDDPTMPVDTLRAFVIGLGWTVVGSVINNFFVHRMPSIRLSAHTVQLLIMPTGKLWHKYMPDRIVSVGGRRVDLNPGPFSYKELMLATIMYSCSAGTPYAVYNIVVLKLKQYYNSEWVTWHYQLVLALSTQFLGFGFAFLMKKVCVYPAKAIWPTILPTIALNRALIAGDDDTSGPRVVHGWRMSRYHFFFVVAILSFAYNILPQYLFTTLSSFNWPTWFNPESVHLANVTGFHTGLGLNPWPTFDWNVADSASCLTIPFFTYVNQYVGSITAFVCILVVYYTNSKWTGYIPINSNGLFDNKGGRYDITRILDDNSRFSPDKYTAYSPPYYSAANLVLYGAYFCLYPFAILYNFINEWSSVRQSFVHIGRTLKGSFQRKTEDDHGLSNMHDPHCDMMSRYAEVPDWWFVAILVLSTCLAIAGVVFYPVQTPIWGIFFTIAINFVFLIPLTSIASVTGFSFGLNVLVELIVGYAIPHSGLALITLKAYGYNIDSQASNYITDQKLAHYAKLPPKAIFSGQIMSTLVSVVIALIITNWQIAHVPDLCTPTQKDKLSCPGASTYFYSSVQFGSIGPAKVFSGLYPVLKWCFLLGALLVPPCLWFKRRGPPTLARYFNPTVILGGFLVFAPYNLSYFTSGLYLSFVFMYYIKTHYLLWWEKYNYILTSALSAGVAFSAILLFFTFQYNGSEPKWWGNWAHHRGVEGTGGVAWLNATAAPDGYFGLRHGHYP